MYQTRSKIYVHIKIFLVVLSLSLKKALFLPVVVCRHVVNNISQSCKNHSKMFVAILLLLVIQDSYALEKIAVSLLKLKFVFSKKATKIEKIFTVDLTLTSNRC